MREVIKLLSEIQEKIKVPKNQYNSFGGYNYRSCEDILNAVKPLLGNAVLVINDEVLSIGDRVYIKATATLSLPTILSEPETISATAYAREAENKKGMDVSQITGATSSYARKYALNGLFAIDDTKDADTQDNSKPSTLKEKDWLTDKQFKAMMAAISRGEVEKVKSAMGKYKMKKDYKEMLTTAINNPGSFESKMANQKEKEEDFTKDIKGLNE